MVIPALGRQIDRIVERLLRSSLNGLLSKWGRMLKQGEMDLLKRFVVQGYGRGALAGWSNHARWLVGIGQIPDKPILQELARWGLELGDLIEARAIAIFRQPQQPLEPDRYIRLVAGLTVRQGMAQGSQKAAEEAEARFKQWVRVYDTKQHRDWHDALEGATIPIQDKFVLPAGPNAGKAVEGPHDWDSLADPREWLNCGHALIYTQDATRLDLKRGAANRKK